MSFFLYLSGIWHKESDLTTVWSLYIGIIGMTKFCHYFSIGDDFQIKNPPCPLTVCMIIVTYTAGVSCQGETAGPHELQRWGQGGRSLKAAGLLRANDLICTTSLEMADGWPGNLGQTMFWLVIFVFSLTVFPNLYFLSHLFSLLEP